MEEILDWVVDYVDEFEFKIGNISFDVNKLITLPKRKLQYFNQNDYTKTALACTIVNAYRQRCHRVGRTFTNEEMFDVVDYCVTQGYKIGSWRGTAQAMNAVNKYVAIKFPEYKTAYITLTSDDSNVMKILIKNHSLGFTYRGNHKRDTDRLDWTLEWIMYSPASYWHRTCITNDTGIMVDDSFSFQNYKIKNFGKLVNGINIYPTLYLRLVDSNLDTETIKKYTQRKIMLEQNINNNEIMLNNPRRKTTDKEFRKSLEEYNTNLKKKLSFVIAELKKNGN